MQLQTSWTVAVQIFDAWSGVEVSNSFWPRGHIRDNMTSRGLGMLSSYSTVIIYQREVMIAIQKLLQQKEV